MPSTFRAQMRSGCASVLSTFKTANPTLLAHTYDHRPNGYRTPCAFVDSVIRERTITHTMGVRQRVLEADIVVVNKLIDNDQTADEQDVLVDELVDEFTTNARLIVSNALCLPISVGGVELTEGDAVYAASVIVIEGSIQEGRSLT